MKLDFDPLALTALRRARDEAAALRHACVGPEHILLALLDDRDATGESLLDAEPREVRTAILAMLRAGDGEPRGGELPYTSRARRALELAMTHAVAGGDARVGRRELLKGVIDEGRSPAAEVLRRFGVSDPASDGAGAAPLPIHIDEASDSSIYEQIVAQVREAVATGELNPGDRLPTVRRLADRLDVAPGTVARAYTELERLGVVVTQGARGTRVAPRRPPPPAPSERADTLVGLLRPVTVAAFHLGAAADDLRSALEAAMRGIFEETEGA